MPIDFSKINTTPCDLHEVWPCAICNGDERRQKEQAMRDRLDVSVRLAPGIVAARFPGHCSWCGAPFDAGSAITFSDEAQGWVSKECCA